MSYRRLEILHETLRDQWLMLISILPNSIYFHATVNMVLQKETVMDYTEGHEIDNADLSLAVQYSSPPLHYWHLFDSE